MKVFLIFFTKFYFQKKKKTLYEGKELFCTGENNAQATLVLKKPISLINSTESQMLQNHAIVLTKIICGMYGDKNMTFNM